ncbi:type IX secretion system protein PorG [Arsenicibacter rosenii]|uniref:DUF6089 domain-containing protein n=1 Tax=Arsenicibacter rosenii TaxID=1750698 RepID=A0A1S2VI89_9BACT|nr:DUF6089 family protein [Arsenicibacter rosenii]OIN58477.1 hypothetical protein BLX24_15420 [Arsenicibacter rosenii]
MLPGLFFTPLALAQQIEIGGGLGTYLYKGDISPSINPRFALPAGNLFFRYNATRSFSARAGIGIGAIKAEDRVSNDPFQQARDYSFRTTIGEISADVEYNFRDFRMVRWPKNWTPYVFAGIGYMVYSPRPVKDKRMMYPLGVGFKYEFRRPWSVGFEFGTRFTNNDTLDGLGPTASLAKLQQGNLAIKDKYTYAAFTLSYTFYKITCPE